MNAPLIIDRIRAVNDDAQEMRILMLDVEAFEIAKQVAGAPRASPIRVVARSWSDAETQLRDAAIRAQTYDTIAALTVLGRAA